MMQRMRNAPNINIQENRAASPTELLLLMLVPSQSYMRPSSLSGRYKEPDLVHKYTTSRMKQILGL